MGCGSRYLPTGAAGRRATGGRESAVIAARPAVVLIAAVSLLAPAAAARDTSAGGRSCVGLSPPVDGMIIAPFDPGPGYEGHWGVDYEGDRDGLVLAAARGTVIFAGLVVHNLVVTVDHGGGLWTSYSYLDQVTVMAGQDVERGTVVGTVGAGTGHGDVHLSVRVDGEYIDPLRVVGCLARAPAAGLRLVEVR